jgi:hypothetical protein
MIQFAIRPLRKASDSSLAVSLGRKQKKLLI